MDVVKVTVIAEDSFGVFFKQAVELPHADLVKPGRVACGMADVAAALLRLPKEG